MTEEVAKTYEENEYGKKWQTVSDWRTMIT